MNNEALKKAKEKMQAASDLVNEAEGLFDEAYADEPWSKYVYGTSGPSLELSGEELDQEIGYEKFQEVLRDNVWISSSSRCW